MKLLASDFDNTLIFDGLLRDNDVTNIKSFQNNNNLFGVCTGRCLSGILEPSLPHNLNYDFYILMSGALILNKEKDIIFEKQLPVSLIKDIYLFLNKQDASLIYKDSMYKIYQEEKPDYPGIYLKSFDELNTDFVSAFSFHYSHDQIDQAYQATLKLKKKYGDIVEIYQNNEHIDLAAKGCSKGHGMKIIQEYFHLDEDQLHAIGDSWNDLPMLDSVNNSYSFDYAHKDVQAHAKKIVKSVAHCIDDIEKSV